MELSPVEALLTKQGISYKIAGKDLVISCLNPKHADNNPSLRVDRLSGVAHCFSCGWKKNLFRHYGVFSASVMPVKVARIKEKIKEIMDSSNKDGVPMPEGAIPYTQKYRGISPATYKKFGAFYTHSMERLEDRIVFPIRDITDKVIAYIGRHVDTNAKKRYDIYPGGIQLSPYPCKFDEPTDTIFLVEGIFDMLNMYDKGAHNTVCAFGTSTLKDDTSRKMLPYKVQGITKINLMFDGDKPGQEAAKELKPLLENAGFEVVLVELPEDSDPSSLSVETIQEIKDFYR